MDLERKLATKRKSEYLVLASSPSSDPPPDPPDGNAMDPLLRRRHSAPRARRWRDAHSRQPKGHRELGVFNGAGGRTGRRVADAREPPQLACREGVLNFRGAFTRCCWTRCARTRPSNLAYRTL
jgi:hypothetical protein